MVDSAKPVQSRPASASYFKLYRYATKIDLCLIALGALAAIGHGLINPFSVYQFGRINNAYGDSAQSPSQAFHEIFKVVLVIIYLGIGSIFLAATEVVCWMLVGENIASQIKTRYLESLLTQEVGFYDMDVRTGDIINAISSDMILVHDAVGEKVAAFIHNISMFLGGIILALTIFWRMGLMGLTATPVLLGAGGAYMALYTKFSIQASAAYKNADQVAEQAISQVRTVYAFVGESRILAAISRSLQEADKLASKTGLSKGLGMGVTLAASYLSWALQFWYGGMIVKQHTMKGGTAYALILLSLFSGKALGDALQVVEPVAKGKAAAFRLFELIERRSEIESSDTGEVALKLEGSIEFCNVSFAYPSRPDVPVFNDLSLEIPQGKIVAVVGPSGSGKSTVVSLIERFYDPQSGEIRIGGTDIKKLQLKWLRQQIGLVSQEPTLFATSIKENILVGKPGSSHEQVVRAAKIANAHGFISELPYAYHTQVGDKGIQLSGGQKQRIAIARAILRKPGIMLLDEATSALDSESELLVQKALDSVMHGRTTVIIAHRLSTIRNADRIVVLDKGRIIQTGTHQELVCQEGMYASLVQLQQINHSSRLESAHPFTKASPQNNYPMESPPTDDLKLQNLHVDSELSAKKGLASYKWFSSLHRKTWVMTLAGSLGACGSGVVTAVFPLLMANIVILFLQNDQKEANKWILAVVGLGVVILFSTTVQYFFGHKSGARISQNIQELSFQGIMKNEVGWFDVEENSSSAITARLSSNATVVRSVISNTYNYFLQNFVAMSLAIILAFICQWQQAFFALAILPIQVGSSAISNTFRAGGLTGNNQQAHEQASQIAGEAASSIRTVLSFGAERNVLAAFKQHLLDTKSKRLKRGIVIGSIFGVSHCMQLIASALSMWFGISLVKKGHTTFGPVLRAITLVAFTALNCVEVLRLVPDFFQGTYAIASVLSIANRKTKIDPESPSGEKLEHLFGSVELENVSLRYPARPGVSILTNLSLSIEAGSTVALVGPSGSGKSSVLALILRFYDPTAGRVLLDGNDIRGLSLRWMRKQIGFVQQEPALFAVSIRENILLGNDSASEAEVIEAARVANAHDFISSLPEGYDTEVGERGAQLSGGQKQRIAIARAIIKNPTILLLDEATSSLDAESERVVQEAIDNIVEKSRTTVVIAHRLSSVRHADSIAVMDSGSIVEKGRHDELLHKNGAYAKLVNTTG